jgi:DNA-binding CsgD family transcriptional regulator
MDSRRALTAVERRVAALVAMGETIPDVAVELGLARKSVEWHLSRVYRKLGVSSRRELLAALAAPGREEISDA